MARSITTRFTKKMSPLNPAALQLEGAAWDYNLTVDSTRYFFNGKYRVAQVNELDPNNPPWRMEIVNWSVAYNEEHRFDWTMAVIDSWPVESSSHSVFQVMSSDVQGHSGSNCALIADNGQFLLTIQWNKGTSPTAGYLELGTIPIAVGTYNLSLRFKFNLTSGWVELWNNNVLVGSAYDQPLGFSATAVFFKYGIYRWDTLTGSLKALHGPVTKEAAHTRSITTRSTTTRTLA